MAWTLFSAAEAGLAVGDVGLVSLSPLDKLLVVGGWDAHDGARRSGCRGDRRPKTRHGDPATIQSARHFTPRGRAGRSRGFEHGGCDADEVIPLRADLFGGFDPKEDADGCGLPFSLLG